MKTVYSSFACLTILLLVFFQTGCHREQIPGEIGSQQLLSIDFPNQEMRREFEYDDQDVLLRIDGQRPGEDLHALEFAYEAGEVTDILSWRITSPTDEYVSHSFRWRQWSPYRTKYLTVQPSLITWLNYEDNWTLYFKTTDLFPDSITWNLDLTLLGLRCHWDASLHQLSAIAKRRIYTQTGWQYVPTDTSYLYHFDESINPLQYRIKVKNPTTLLQTLSPTNLVSVDTIFPDQRVNSFVRTIEYDDQDRPVVISYEQDGEMIREEWTYRR